jgi:hypothetical protein
MALPSGIEWLKLDGVVHAGTASERLANKFRSFSAVGVRMFPSRSAGNCRVEIQENAKSLKALISLA